MSLNRSYGFEKNKGYRTLFITAGLIALFILADYLGITPLSPGAPRAGSGQVAVHFVDVGQGKSIVVVKDGKAVIIDGGERSAGPDLLKFLNSQHVAEIALIVMTHPHSDHIGGLVEIPGRFYVERAWISPGVTNTKVYEDFLIALEENEIPSAIPNPLDVFMLDDVKFTVLGPKAESENLNDCSIMLKMEYGNSSFIFTGDAEAITEREAMETAKSAGISLKANVLDVGHHGSATSTSDGFLAEVSPSAAVISLAAYNQYNHPDAGVVDKLNASGAAVYLTYNGTVTFITDGTTIDISQ